ncbi:hypothetical protein C8R45DRAFT_945158 [Mycena sanguinolenta]|nr:hypothetical protein C8R45DRAFT_945158 [Mycena sanguinolenta]
MAGCVPLWQIYLLMAPVCTLYNIVVVSTILEPDSKWGSVISASLSYARRQQQFTAVGGDIKVASMTVVVSVGKKQVQARTASETEKPVAHLYLVCTLAKNQDGMD